MQMLHKTEHPPPPSQLAPDSLLSIYDLSILLLCRSKKTAICISQLGAFIICAILTQVWTWAWNLILYCVCYWFRFVHESSQHAIKSNFGGLMEFWNIHVNCDKTKWKTSHGWVWAALLGILGWHKGKPRKRVHKEFLIIKLLLSIFDWNMKSIFRLKSVMFGTTTLRVKLTQSHLKLKSTSLESDTRIVHLKQSRPKFKRLTKEVHIMLYQKYSV